MDRLAENIAENFPPEDRRKPLYPPVDLSTLPRPDSPRPFLLALAQIYPRDEQLVRLFPHRYDDLDHPAFLRLALALEKFGFDQTGQDTGREVLQINRGTITYIQAQAHTCFQKLSQHYAYSIACDDLPRSRPIIPEHLRRPWQQTQEPWPGLKGERDLLNFLYIVSTALNGLDSWLWRTRQYQANVGPSTISNQAPKLHEENKFDI